MAQRKTRKPIQQQTRDTILRFAAEESGKPVFKPRTILEFPVPVEQAQQTWAALGLDT